MPVQDDDRPAEGAPEFIGAPAEIDFLGGKQFLAETAERTEGAGLDKDERARAPSQAATDPVPKPGHQPTGERRPIESNGGTAGETFARLDGGADFGKQVGSGPGVGIDKHQPVARGGGRATVPGPGNLVVWFKNNAGAIGLGNGGGAVGRVIVAHDQFDLPIQIGEGVTRLPDAAQRFAEKFFLVECWNDNRDFHNGPSDRCDDLTTTSRGSVKPIAGYLFERWRARATGRQKNNACHRPTPRLPSALFLRNTV